MTRCAAESCGVHVRVGRCSNPEAYIHPARHSGKPRLRMRSPRDAKLARRDIPLPGLRLGGAPAQFHWTHSKSDEHGEAYWAGWVDGCFGERANFIDNPHLARWEAPSDRLAYYRGHRAGAVKRARPAVVRSREQGREGREPSRGTQPLPRDLAWSNAPESLIRGANRPNQPDTGRCAKGPRSRRRDPLVALLGSRTRREKKERRC